MGKIIEPTSFIYTTCFSGRTHSHPCKSKSLQALEVRAQAVELIITFNISSMKHEQESLKAKMGTSTLQGIDEILSSPNLGSLHASRFSRAPSHTTDQDLSPYSLFNSAFPAEVRGLSNDTAMNIYNKVNLIDAPLYFYFQALDEAHRWQSCGLFEQLTVFRTFKFPL